MPRFSPKSPKNRSAGKDAKASIIVTSRVGEPIVHTGIYRALHAGYRVSHYVVLLSGQNFPRCARCGDEVQFQLFEATSEIQNDPGFRVHLYEIPHPPPAAGEKEDEVA